MFERFRASVVFGDTRYSRSFCYNHRREYGKLFEGDDYKHCACKNLGRASGGSCGRKVHETIRKSVWGYAKDETLTMKQLLNEDYQGIRPAVGYPSLPDISVSFLLDELLDMKRIGIQLTENGMMQPHASVCGLMFAHPASRYFSVGKIDEERLPIMLDGVGFPQMK